MAELEIVRSVRLPLTWDRRRLQRRGGGLCCGPMRLLARLYRDAAQMGVPSVMRLVGFAAWRRDNLKIQDRGVLGVVEYFLVGHAQFDGGCQGFACPRGCG
jgi:hypothetical protein